MNDLRAQGLQGPCYGLVQRVYKNGDIQVSLYPDAGNLSLFLFKPGSCVRQRVSRTHVYEASAVNDVVEKGQLVRFDQYRGSPRYLVCHGRFRPGQLQKWQEKLGKCLRPGILSRYSELVDRKFLDALPEHGEKELASLERVIDAFSYVPVREFLDELEAMLMRYVNKQRP